MTVSDVNGKQCTDSANLVVSIAAESEDVDEITLSIELIAAATTINVAESLGLTVIWTNISNPDDVKVNDPDVSVKYTWTENSDQLSAVELADLNIVQDEGSGNLVLPPNTLEPGVYQFNITIDILFQGVLKGRSSSAQTITVKTGPLITI